ncbi:MULTISPECIES: hypothetical protein [Vibrio oreintalis group]|uniref:Uncharacterized protein n=1 Tax=Vibrio bivalvicida TaxID=1276888 RepID=A0ABV4MPJ2_9VIBR|nr:hypothetical protein [Vibrio tubiashii]
MDILCLLSGAHCPNPVSSDHKHAMQRPSLPQLCRVNKPEHSLPGKNVLKAQ